MTWRTLHRVADEHGLITRAKALRGGYDDRDLRRLVRSGAWERLRRGVYVERDLWDQLDPFRGRPVLAIRAAQLTLVVPHVLSHDSAAILLGIGAPDPVTALVHVTHRKVHGDAERAGVKHHLAPYRPHEVVVADGLEVLGPARTALDLAREHGLVAGVAACDQVLRRGVTMAQLLDARSRMWCWPGSRTMDEALALADPGAESWLESKGRVFVSSLGLGRPRTQFGLTDGRRTVYCDLRLGRHVIEVDGMSKYLEAEDGRTPYDVLRVEKERQDFVTGFKLGVSRLTVHDMRSGHRQAAARIRREHADTCARFGTDISDLAPYLAPPRRLR